jgi:polyphosphate kinase 2 (PPK2 family)
LKERSQIFAQWKITDEDWRNHEKLDQYRDAVEEMLHRTTTPLAPWTIVESNCKRYARVKVLEVVCEAIRQRLE